MNRTVFKLLALLIVVAAPVFAAESVTQDSDHYGLASLLPSVLAISMALLTRQVLISLFLGIWAGGWLIAGGDAYAVWQGLLSVVDHWLIEAIVPSDASTDHFSIALFTLLTGGTVGIISANGGIPGVIDWVSRHVNSAKGGQLAGAITGLCMCFDDYASMIITGNTMRPLADKLHVSREKLAYIVDTTAAPIASVAIFSTWIGFQVSLIETAMRGIPSLSVTPYELMVASIPYSYYSILSVLFILLVIFTKRDFGAMWKAESRARQTQLSSSDEMPTVRKGKAVNAILPILVLIFGVLTGLIATGWKDGASLWKLTDILGNADPFKAMLWASLMSLIVALLLSLLNSPLKVGQTIEAMERGFRPMLAAVIILTLAWAIANVNDALGTANYLVGLLRGNISPELIPAMIFVLASAIAFATGTSWGVMGILLPLALPLTWQSMELASMTDAAHMPILYAAVASVLSGAVLGDHCSPISDTTILSSIASGCDHIEHVRTQLPYAVLVGAVSIVLGLIPAGYGFPWWAGMIVGIAMLYITLCMIGRKV